MGASSTCPICQQHPETDKHFLTCGGAQGWKEYLLDPIDKLFHKQKAGHWIASGIRTNMILFLNQTSPHHVHPWIQPAIDSQTELGWQSVFYGIFSNLWAPLQNKCHSPANGSTLISKLIKLVFAAIVTRWNNRNNSLHHRRNQTEIRSRLHTQILALYNLQDQILHQDRPIFKIPITQLLTQSTKSLQLFIEQNKKLVKCSIQHQQQQTQRQHRDIRTYFLTQHTTINYYDTRVTQGKYDLE